MHWRSPSSLRSEESRAAGQPGGSQRTRTRVALMQRLADLDRYSKVLTVGCAADCARWRSWTGRQRPAISGTPRMSASGKPEPGVLLWLGALNERLPSVQ